MRSWLRPLALVTAIGMLVVVIMGATVTNTGSAEGCGRSWPLCHGQLIPAFAVATLIEFSHRAVTGVETALVLATAGGAWYSYRRHAEIRILAPLMVGTLFLQALMGAWAVLYPQTSLVLALHFGISLAAFASTVLTYTFLRDLETGAHTVRTRLVPLGYRRLAWFTLAYSLVVVYLGAYIRHASMEMACLDWPLCNGQVLPPLARGVYEVLAHRGAALGIIVLLGALMIWSWRLGRGRPDLAFGSTAAFGLVILQSLSGALVVFTRLDLWSALLHAGIMALLFGSLSYVCLQVLPAFALRAAKAAPPPESRLLTQRR